MHDADRKSRTVPQAERIHVSESLRNRGKAISNEKKKDRLRSPSRCLPSTLAGNTRYPEVGRDVKVQRESALRGRAGESERDVPKPSLDAGGEDLRSLDFFQAPKRCRNE